jgi:hypothetical protein
MDTERKRLEFVQDRDGTKASILFAEQMIDVYTKRSIVVGPYEKEIEAARAWIAEWKKVVDTQ